jgi:hypothetical protein
MERDGTHKKVKQRRLPGHLDTLQQCISTISNETPRGGIAHDGQASLVQLDYAPQIARSMSIPSIHPTYPRDELLQGDVAALVRVQQLEHLGDRL